MHLPISSEVMRYLLLFCMLGMALLAAFFLRRRNLSRSETVVWSLVILLVPLVGPFLAILARPGETRQPKD